MATANNHSTSQSTEDASRLFIADGRIELLQVLGEGGFGRVYLAYGVTERDDEPKYYAVKCMPRYAADDPRTEAQAQEMGLHEDVADHPHVLDIHDVYGDDDFVYVVLDYCRGGDMFKAAFIKQIYVNNDELIKKVFLQLIDAVHHCHERGVFHRDLKIENVLLSNRRGDSIRLADFGLASNQPKSAAFGCGTRNYMSPEAFSGCSSKPFCHRANDVWCLGMILFNMITGDHPWKHASFTDKGFDAFISDPHTLRAQLPTVTDAAFDIFLRILDLDPVTRIELPELREKVLKLDSVYRKQPAQPTPSRPRVARKALQLIPVKGAAAKNAQRKPAAIPTPVVAHHLGKGLKDFEPLVITELKERVAGIGDGFLVAVT